MKNNPPPPLPPATATITAATTATSTTTTATATTTAAAATAGATAGATRYECAYTFVNEEDGPLECTFFFPKQPHAAVAGLAVEITDADGKTSRTIRGVVQEKEKAQATYDGESGVI